MGLSSVNDGSVYERFDGRATVISTIIACGGKGLLRLLRILIRMVKRALYHDSRYVSVRTINARTRGTAGTANSRFRILVGELGRIYLVYIFGRAAGHDLNFDVVRQEQGPKLHFDLANFGRFVVRVFYFV